MKITTDRLIVRKFKDEDWQVVHEYTSDINVMKYIPEGVFSEKDTIKFVNMNSKENAKYFPVIKKEDHSLIGHIVFHKYLVNTHMK